MAEVRRRTDVAYVEGRPVEYRLEQHGADTVVVFHGGHMRAGLALGEGVFTEGGYSLLVPSRPGYGRTPVQTGTSPDGFADVVAELCDRLGIERIAAVVGISAGGRTALAMAARYPRLVSRVVLESAVGFRSWPDHRTRIVANVVFNGRMEKVTWGAVRILMRFAPGIGLRLLLGDLSTKPNGEVLASLGDEDRATLVGLFAHMRSGAGFLNDVRGFQATTPAPIGQPTLVIASPTDAAVPFAHAESLVTTIPGAELVESGADSHFLWFSKDYPVIAERIRSFLAAQHPNEPQRRW